MSIKSQKTAENAAYTLDIPNTPGRFSWYVSKPYWRSMSFALSALFFACLLEAAEPFFYRYIFDTFSQYGVDTPVKMIWWGIGGYVGVVLVRMIMWRLVMIGGSPWLTGTRAHAREKLTAHLLRHSHTYFEGRFAGSTANKIAHASDGARNLAELATIEFIPVIFSIVLGIGTAFYANTLLGIIFTIWLCFAIPINMWLSQKRIPYTLTAQRSETILRGVTVDIVSNIRAVHEFVASKIEMSGLAPLIAKRRRAGMENMIAGQVIVLVNCILYVLMLGAMLGTTAHLVLQSVVSVGTLALVLSLTVNVGDRIFSLGWRLSNIVEAWGEVKEGLDDILLPHEIEETALTDAQHQKGAIEFHDVAFSYGESDMLQQFNLQITQGERVGIVGKSGAGKSTLVKLLLRHHTVQSGIIAIGGENITSMSLDTLRTSIGVIPQEPNLFHRSIRENIAYGSPHATDEEIIEAAKHAEMHDFIASLEAGYETLVGERGVKLSGGQRQRIAIARAMLKNAPILVLDEATSALDSESEVAIQKALHELMEEKTVIAIAHRLSTLREMDRIIVLDQGKIVEDGTHDELVKMGGLYARLWEHQAGGFLQE